MRPHSLFLTLLLLTQSQAFSQSADSLAEIRRQIDILTQEIERLKLGAVDESVYESFAGLGPAASKIYGTKKTGVSLAGYGEVLYQNFSSNRDDNAPATSKDQLDYYRNIIYVGYRFNDWVLFNSEIEFEHGSTGGGGSVSIEFGYIDLLFSKEVNLRAGMVLVPVGLANEYHEPPTFFSTDRPAIERIIIPSTWRTNGLGLFGSLSDGLDYRMYMVEGLRMSGFSGSNGIRSGRQSGAFSIVEDFGYTGRLEYRGLPGASVGASFYAGKSGQGEKDSVGVPIDAMTTVLSLHGQYAWRGVEVRALYARTSVDEADRVAEYIRWKAGAGTASAIGSTMDGWYVSAGYDVIPLLWADTRQSLSPFLQYEAFNTHASVPAGFTPNASFDRTSTIVGLVWRPHPNVAFKADYRDHANGAGNATDQWNVAVTYLY